MRGGDRYYPSSSMTLKKNCLTAVLFCPVIDMKAVFWYLRHNVSICPVWETIRTP